MLIKSILLIIICSLMSVSVPLFGMIKRSNENIMSDNVSNQGSNELKRENTEILDLSLLSLQSPEKKARTNEHKVIHRPVKRVLWQEAVIAGTQLSTFNPIEKEEIVEVMTDPLMHAVYHDKIEDLIELLNNPHCNLGIFSVGLLDQNEPATLLDIAASQRSYKCLAYFAEILNCREPIQSLSVLATQALPLTDLIAAQKCLSDLTIQAYRAKPTIYALQVTKPKLITLMKTAQGNALRIARKMSDLKGSQLLWECTKRQELFK